MKTYGLTFKGKPFTEASGKALKNLAPFLGDKACARAYSLLESFCPEVRKATLLMRIAQLTLAGEANARESSASARQSLVFIFDSLRVYRIVGACPDTYTVSKVTGQEKRTPALVQVLFKKDELIAFVMHEFALTIKCPDDGIVLNKVKMFRTPLTLMKHFSASGEEGVVDTFRRRGSLATTDDFETAYAVAVADYRDEAIHDPKTQALIDFAWGVWSGKFDDEILELCCQDMQNNLSTFLWHRYLHESTKEMGVKYRVFVEACSKGPITNAPAGRLPVGASELIEEDREDLSQVQETLLALRRKTVSFVTLPSVGGASGAEFSKLQLEKLWETMRTGHQFSRKNRRARIRPLGRPLRPKRGKAWRDLCPD